MTNLITHSLRRLKLELKRSAAQFRFLRSIRELDRAIRTNAQTATAYGNLYNYQSIMDLERKTEIYRERVCLIEDQIKAL